MGMTFPTVCEYIKMRCRLLKRKDREKMSERRRKARDIAFAEKDFLEVHPDHIRIESSVIVRHVRTDSNAFQALPDSYREVLGKGVGIQRENQAQDAQ